MYEVDAGVGLEQVAPRSLARMRLAGQEQDTQLVAHAVDGDDRAIVDARELAPLERRGFAARRRRMRRSSHHSTGRLKSPSRTSGWAKPSGSPAIGATQSVSVAKRPLPLADRDSSLTPKRTSAH
jgi:hypothetical protein